MNYVGCIHCTGFFATYMLLPTSKKEKESDSAEVAGNNDWTTHTHNPREMQIISLETLIMRKQTAQSYP